MTTEAVLAQRIEQKLAAFMRLASEISDPALDLDETAGRCDEAARELNGTAALLRRLAKQQKKSGAAGAVHETRKL